MKFVLILACGFLLQFTSSTHAEEQSVLASNSKGLSVSISDLMLEAERFPPDVVKSALGNAENIRRLAQNLLIRRSLASVVEQSPLMQDPQVQAKLKLARERVLSEAKLVQIDGTAPDRALLEKLALAQYNAQINKYRQAEAIQIRKLLVGKYRTDGRQLTEELLKQLREGKESFGELAAKYSDDSATRVVNGDLGFVVRGQLEPKLDEVAYSLQAPGSISDIVETAAGWNILQLVAKRASGFQPFDSVKEELMKAAAMSVLEKRRSGELLELEADIKFEEKAIESVVTSNRSR